MPSIRQRQFDSAKPSILDGAPALIVGGIVAIALVLIVPAYFYFVRLAEDRYVSGYSDFWLATAAPVFASHFENHFSDLPLANPEEGAPRAEVMSRLSAIAASGELLNLRVWGGDGALLYSLDEPPRGQETPPDPALSSALRGKPVAEIEADSAARNAGKVLKLFVPITGAGGDVANVMELHYPVAPLVTAMWGVRERLLGFLALLLTGVVSVGLGAIYLLARRKRRFEALSQQDPLTGLANRRYFLERLESAARTGPGLLSLQIWGLKGLEAVNDLSGHEAGDRVVLEAAERLRKVAAPRALATRLDGTEFAVIGPVGSEEEAVSAALRVQTDLSRPFSSSPLRVTVRGGLAVANTPTSGRDLLRRAQIALRHAKQRPDGSLAVANGKLEAEWERKQVIEASLADAVTKGELTLEYQPIVDLESGTVLGMEALVRWHHPQLGLIPPGEFISIAEQIGAVAEIDDWVRRTAFRQASAWLDEVVDPGRFQIRVNLSVADLEDSNLADRIREALCEAQLQPQRVELEITETAIMHDPDVAVARLREIRALGISIALDDFGTGQSSLSYLKMLRARTLKVDRSFVADLEGDPLAQEVIRGLVQLGRRFHFQVLAEGIETPAQRALLLRLGCRLGQGYLFGRPMPETAAGSMLAAGTTREERAAS